MQDRVKDLHEIQFKIHNEFKIFEISTMPNTAGVHLLSAASTYGLIFAGNPYAPRLNVFKHNDIVDAKYDNSALKTRVLELPSPATAVACNADGNLLAITYNMNNSPFLQIYNTQSFFTPNVTSICTIRLSAEVNTGVTELLWNPVLSHCLAVILNNGAIGMYTLKDDGQFDIKTLDKSLETQCGSWSPKGKQIVLAFANGKLQQYKPDLTACRTILFPKGVLENPFNTLSVCWLSTYQFAVVLLEQTENAFPHIVIVNAPKGAEVTHRDFYDVCYSSDGPRKHNYMLIHVSHWNLLLILSANGVELGVLGTTEKNETPNWIQYSCPDEARVALPLTDDHSDHFATGFCVDTASKHRTAVKESEIGPMPMIHILTTHGMLQTYSFRNLFPDMPNLCSPPAPKSDTSAKFSLLKVEDYRKKSVKEEINATQTMKPKPVAGFGNLNNQPFANMSSFSAPSLNQNKTEGLPKFKQSNLMTVKPNVTLSTTVNKTSTDPPKPLYAVSGDYVLTDSDNSRRKSSHEKVKPFPDHEVMRKHVVYLDMLDFDREIQKTLTKPLNIMEELGDPKEFRNDTLTLLDLEKTIGQADTKDFQQEVRHLRHGIIDMYSVLEEINANVALSKHSDIRGMRPLLGFDKYNLRLVNKANEQIKNNEILMRKAELELDKQWILYQDLLRHDTPKQITTPRLNPIFQRLSKLVQMSNRNMDRIDYLKTAFHSLGIRHKSKHPRRKIDLNNTEEMSTLEILAKSILGKNAKSPPSKHSLHINPKYKRVALCAELKKKVQVIKHIKSKRIKRSDINSHAVLEARIRNLPPIRDGASTNVEKMQQQMLPQKNIIEPSHTHLAKPTATKPVMIPTQTVFAPVGQTSTSGFNFGGTSPFVKTAAAVKSDEPARPIAVFPSNAGMMNFSGYHAPTTSSSGISATANPLLVQPKATTNKAEPRKDLQSLSFVAKVVGGEPTKPNIGQPLVAPTTAGIAYLTDQNTPKTVTVTVTQPAIVIKSEVKNLDTATATSVSFSFLGDKTNFTTTFNTAKGTPFDSKTMPTFGMTSATAVVTTPTTTPSTGFSFALPPNATSTISVKTTAAPVVTTSAATVTPSTKSQIFSPDAKGGFVGFGVVKPQTSTTKSPTPVSDPTDTLMSNLNICKPTTKEIGTKATTVTATTVSMSGNIFAGLGSGTGNSLFFNSLTPSSTTFSFGATGSSFSKPLAAVGQTQVPTATTTVTTTVATAAVVITTVSATKTTPTVKATPTTKPAVPTTITPAITISTTITTTLPNTTTTQKPVASPKLPTMQKPGTTTTTTTPVSATIAPVLATSTIIPQSSNIFSPTITSSTTIGPNVIKTAANTALINTASTAAISTGTPAPTLQAAFSALSSLGASTPETKALTTNTTTSFTTPIFTVAAASTTANPAVITTTVSASSKADVSTTASATTASSFFGAPSTLFGNSGLFTTPVPIPPTTLFGGVTKSESSVFAGTAGIFSPAASNTTGGNIFSPPKKDPTPFSISTGGNLFGSSQQPVNVFGNQESSSNTGSIFAAVANKPAESNIFASAAKQPSENLGGGTLFGQFGQNTQATTGNIFSSSAAISQAPTTGFSTGGSLFGTAPANNMSTLFSNSSGGGTTSTFGSTNTGMGFGSFNTPNITTPAFSSPNAGNSFAQGGASVSQTGFGSPQQTSAFAKPVFGNTASFGSPPAFGTQPSFGGAATFGSPKSFGSFASPTSTSPTANTFGGPQKNNLFETLGSTDSGLSFGNLAQATQNNPPKPAFGGSSFMNYRA